jgi:hypothetical protein
MTMEMDEMVSCDDITTRAREMTMYIHCYEGDDFSIHVCN